MKSAIIPLREMEGNYNSELLNQLFNLIIPLREMEGNYNLVQAIPSITEYYTLERDGRELQRHNRKTAREDDYTLERDGRELQLTIAL